jgi:hypothetical protein
VINAAPPTLKAAAIALGRHVLDDAVLPSGAHPFNGSAPTGLRGPSVPGIGNLVFAHQLWTVDDAPHAVWQWLQAHVPNGYVKTETSSGKDGGVPSWGVEDDLSAVPLNVSTAELQLAVVGDNSGGAVIRVDSVVGWTAPRPADEFVSPRDNVMIVSTVHAYEPGMPVGRRVVVSNPTRVRPIVRAFNQLRLTPPDGPFGHECGLIRNNAVVYRVAFATAPTARPDIVASLQCYRVGVTVNGRPAPTLQNLPNRSLNELGHLLGIRPPYSA